MTVRGKERGGEGAAQRQEQEVAQGAGSAATGWAGRDQ